MVWEQATETLPVHLSGPQLHQPVAYASHHQMYARLTVSPATCRDVCSVPWWSGRPRRRTLSPVHVGLMISS